MIGDMKLWSSKKENLPSAGHAFRTAIAAAFSILIAQFAGLPEAYWAAIAALLTMQSPEGTTMPLAIERIVASALGASLGAIESKYFGSSLIAFVVAVFLLGVVSFAVRLEKIGYGYACVTLAIVVLISRPVGPWTAAWHRFAEISIGILVALLVVAVWRGRARLFRGSAAD